MKSSFWRPLGTAFCAACLLGAASMPAQAANTISVQVDDKPVQFTDAAPLLRADRTYVPFRAIFEQMNAEVSWDGATQTVTAVRDARTVQFQIGKTAVSITENNATKTVQTDAAPFVEGGRTYVPVRFASEALGACVDWVQDTKTVLIVDAAKMAQDYALDYTYVDDYLNDMQYDRSASGNFTLNLKYQTAMGEIPVNMTGTLTGSMTPRASEFTGKVTTDTEAIQAAIEKNEGKDVLSNDMKTFIQSLGTADLHTIVSREDDMLYLSGANVMQLGAQQDGWAGVSLESVAGDLAGALLRGSANGSFADTVADMAQNLDLKSAPDATVATVRNFMELAKKLYGDDAWNAETAVKTLKVANGSTICNMTLDYGTQSNPKSAKIQISSTENAVKHQMNLTQDEKGYQLELHTSGANMVNFDFSMNMNTTQNSGAVNVRPSEAVTTLTLD